ncbi:MAG TPA: acetolactate decarboxylase [Polyangiaceae bacterium]|nr:acetolactate decarboxylase [Polyangiaceae bacterium]
MIKGFTAVLAFGLSLGAAAIGGVGVSHEKSAVLYHASFRAAYQAGTYDGTFSMEQLRAHGDFGLGATDGNDGGLTALGGIFWRARTDGTMVELGPKDTTPYAAVTFFRPGRTLRFRGEIGREELEKKLDAELDPGHRPYAIRVRGRFAHVEAGASDRQEKPHRPFAQVLDEYHYHDFQETQGTLVGFRCPPYMKVLDQVGYHFHYLSDDKKQGGHVRGFAIDDVEVGIQELSAFTADLPAGGEFYEKDMAAP